MCASWRGIWSGDGVCVGKKLVAYGEEEMGRAVG